MILYESYNELFLCFHFVLVHAKRIHSCVPCIDGAPSVLTLTQFSNFNQKMLTQSSTNSKTSSSVVVECNSRQKNIHKKYSFTTLPSLMNLKNESPDVRTFVNWLKCPQFVNIISCIIEHSFQLRLDMLRHVLNSSCDGSR